MSRGGRGGAEKAEALEKQKVESHEEEAEKGMGQARIKPRNTRNDRKGWTLSMRRMRLGEGNHAKGANGAKGTDRIMARQNESLTLLR